MNTKITLLAILLVLQMMLIFALVLDTSSSEQDSQRWLEFVAESVDKVRMNDADNEVELHRIDGVWQVGALKADAGKLMELLQKLQDIQAPWPVAASTSSRERFEVAADKYQRRVQLLAGDSVILELYLGTSPGFQRVHARKSDQDEIYSVELSNYELPVETSGWMDTALLSTAEPLDEVTVTLADGTSHRLRRDAEGWLYNDGAAEQDAAATYVNRFKTLQVLGSADAELAGAANEVAEIELLWLGGSKRIFVTQHEEEYLLRQDQGSFKVATYIAEQLLLTDVDLAAVADAVEAPAEVEQQQ